MEKILAALPMRYLYSQEQLKNQRLDWYLKANTQIFTSPSHKNFAVFVKRSVTDTKISEPIVPLNNIAIPTKHQSFVTKLMPYAKLAEESLALDKGALIAQAALETNWGQAIIKNINGQSSHNLFNIKAVNKVDVAQAITVSTKEYSHDTFKKIPAAFKSYRSFETSFKDYIHLIQNNHRYQQALKAVNDPKQYFIELQKAGYATDPNYAEKVWTIYQQLIRS